MKSKKLLQKPIVAVRFYDHVMGSDKPLECEIYGRLVRKTRRLLVVAHWILTKSRGGAQRDNWELTSILRSTIKRVVRLSMLGLAFSTSVGCFVESETERASLFEKDAFVRVYAADGRHLFGGRVKAAQAPFVTLCGLRGVAIAGPFREAQCLVVDTRGPWLLVEAHMPDERRSK